MAPVLDVQVWNAELHTLYLSATSYRPVVLLEDSVDLSYNAN
jgi:hypothetical protein